MEGQKYLFDIGIFSEFYNTSLELVVDLKFGSVLNKEFQTDHCKFIVKDVLCMCASH